MHLFGIVLVGSEASPQDSGNELAHGAVAVAALRVDCNLGRYADGFFAAPWPLAVKREPKRTNR